MSAVPRKSPTVADRLMSGGKVATAMAGVEIGKQAYSQAKGYWERRLRYTVTVSDDDHLYGEVHAWLLGLLPGGVARALKVMSGGDSEPVSDLFGSEARPPLRYLYDDKRPKSIVVDGARVMVRIIHPDTVQGTNRRDADRIEFTCYTKAGQDAVLRHLHQISAATSARKPALHVVSRWGDWSIRSDMPTRTLDSVILPEEQKTDIVEDLRDFLAAEPRYNRLALPWHRGYMFAGPPGTGKTSLVKALAAEFGLDLWYMPLSDLTHEASLSSLLSSVSPRSILLLEDIDTVKITHDRDENPATGTRPGISLSSLLNCLDGVLTPHGLISVMTTNNLDALDPALRRSGRMDRTEILALPSTVEIEAMFRRFFGRPPRRPVGIHTAVSHADVSEVFKRHLNDPVAAETALHRRLHTDAAQVSR